MGNKLKKLKSTVCFLLMFLLLFSLTPQKNAFASSSTTKSNGIFEYIELSDGTVEIRKYLGTDTDVIIPGNINGKPVRIGERAFEGTNITGVMFEGVVSIGDYAFAYCTNLQGAIFLCDEPMLNYAESIFEGTPYEFKVYLPLYANGWYINKYGQWYGYNVATEDEMMQIPGTQTHTHSYGSWTSDGSTYHKRTCSCGDVERKPHTWRSSFQSIGQSGHVKTCTVCGARSSSSPHSLVKVETSNGYYHKCSAGCGYQTAVTKTHTHSYGSWTSDGSNYHKRTCSCGNVERKAHTWSSSFQSIGQSGHVKTCTVCGAKSSSSPHSLVKVETSDGYYQKCSDGCGYQTTPQLDPQKKFKTNGVFEYIELSDGTVEITNYLGTDRDVIIPGKIDNKLVRIGERAFEGTNITGVMFKEGLISIGDYAFAYCTNLQGAFFLCDEPMLGYAESIFEGTPYEFKVYLPLYANGWYINKYGQWYGYNVATEDEMMQIPLEFQMQSNSISKQSQKKSQEYSNIVYIDLDNPKDIGPVFAEVGKKIQFQVKSKADRVKYDVINSASIYLKKADKNLFEGSWTPNESDRYDPVSLRLGHDNFRTIKFSTYSAGVQKVATEVKYAVLSGNRDFYLDQFKKHKDTFKWKSPTDNPFIYAYSNSYICGSYVSGVYDQLMSPGTIFYNKIESNDPKWKMYPKTIYYGFKITSGGNAGCYQGSHIVKVVEWIEEEGPDKGKPKTIESKEGSAEVIRIPAYIIDENGELNFDIYMNKVPVGVGLKERHKHVWNNNNLGPSGHRKECKCGQHSETILHTLKTEFFGNGICYQRCTAPGCGYVTDPLPHTHVYGEWTSHDFSSHKRTCICGNIQKEEHNIKRTYTDDGYTEVCVTDGCMYKKSHTHSYGSWTLDDEDKAYHKRTCSCGNVQKKEHNIKRTYTDDGYTENCTVEGCTYKSHTQNNKRPDAGVPSDEGGTGNSYKTADINKDGIVDARDCAIVESYYGKNSKSTDWDEAKIADMNGDNRIDIVDFSYVASKID